MHARIHATRSLADSAKRHVSGQELIPWLLVSHATRRGAVVLTSYEHRCAGEPLLCLPPTAKGSVLSEHTDLVLLGRTTPLDLDLRAKTGRVSLRQGGVRHANCGSDHPNPASPQSPRGRHPVSPQGSQPPPSHTDSPQRPRSRPCRRPCTMRHTIYLPAPLPAGY